MKDKKNIQIEDNFLEIANRTSALSDAILNNDFDSILSAFCSASKYKDEIWRADLFSKMKTPKNTHSIRFLQCPKEYIDECKMFAIKRLLLKNSPRYITECIASFCRFSKTLTDKKNLKDINEYDIQNWYEIIFDNSSAGIPSVSKRNSWFHLRTFFFSLDYHKQTHIMNKYIIPTCQKKVVADRYIPEYAARQLDIIMSKENVIPQTFRFIYWTLRLIPCRITEVLNIRSSCLKQFSDDVYTISIPTSKQEGPYSDTLRVISIKNKGIGRIYIDLVKKQIERWKNLAKIDGQDLICVIGQYMCKSYKDIRDPVIKESNKYVHYVEGESFNRFMSTIINHYSVTDENGDIVHVTSHYFRHNGISDRINSGIFREVDIQAMTYHLNTKMIEENYYHAKESKPEEKEMVFSGRIINTNNNLKLEQITNRPFAVKIRGLGICSDSRECNSDRSKCLFCSHLLIDNNNLPFLIEDKNQWEKKLSLAKNVHNPDYVNLCQEMINGYTHLIQKINIQEE